MHLFGEEVNESPTRRMLAQPINFKALSKGLDDDLFERVFGMSTELTGMGVVGMRHRSINIG